MPEVLSKEAVNELEKGSLTGYALSKMSALDLIATVRSRDEIIDELQREVKRQEREISSLHAELEQLNKESEKHLQTGIMESMSKVGVQAKLEGVEQASRDFLNAYRAHHVSNSTESHALTVSRLIDAEKRLTGLLADGIDDTKNTEREIHQSNERNNPENQ